MPFKVADYAKQIIGYGKQGFEPLAEADSKTIIERYGKNKKDYEPNARSITSYFLLHFADAFIIELEKFDDKYKPKTWKGSAASAVGGPIAAYLLESLEENGVNDAARYLGDGRVPEVCSDQLFLQGLWIEWILKKLTQGIGADKPIDTGSNILNGMLTSQIENTRLKAITKSLDKYVNQPNKKFLAASLLDFRTAANSIDFIKKSDGNFQFDFSQTFASCNKIFITVVNKLHPQTIDTPQASASSSSSSSSSSAAYEQKEHPVIPRLATLTKALLIYDDKLEALLIMKLEHKNNDKLIMRIDKLRNAIWNTREEINTLTKEIHLDQEVMSAAALPPESKESQELTLAKNNIKYLILAYQAQKEEETTGKKRSVKLLGDVQVANTLDSIKDIIAQFVRTGQTDTDTNRFSFSHAKGNSLRQKIIESFCPKYTKALILRIKDPAEIKKHIYLFPDPQQLSHASAAFSSKKISLKK
jgi:hypothetical protein